MVVCCMYELQRKKSIPREAQAWHSAIVQVHTCVYTQKKIMVEKEHTSGGSSLALAFGSSVVNMEVKSLLTLAYVVFSAWFFFSSSSSIT
jgi:hypothetical protein